MKNILGLAIALLYIVIAPLPGFAGGVAKTTLKGKVTDKSTGQTIIGASIYIPELQSGAVTDIDGNYTLNNLPVRKVLVQVKFLGYKNVVQTVDLTQTTTFDVALEPAVTEVSEVVVTGTSKATEIKQSPIAIKTIDASYLQQNQGTNIIDAVAKVPGVSAVTTGPNVSKPFIRGLGYNRILTLFDGSRQEGQQWGDEHGIEVDEYAVDHVEIVKGPASLTYGSDALGGVVNLLPAPPVPEGHIVGDVLANYQTNNRLIGNSLMLSGNQNGVVWSIRGSHKMATNYQNPIDGRVYGTAYRETDASGYVGLNRSWGFSQLAFTLYDDLQEIPDGSRDSLTRQFTQQISEEDTLRPIVSDDDLSTYKIATLHQHVQHYRVYVKNSIFAGKGKIDINLGYQRSVRREYSHPEIAEVPGLYLLLQTGTYDLKYHLPEMKGWELTVGVNGMYQANSNKGTEFIIPDYREIDAGPFAQVTKHLGKVELSAGLRYDIRSFSNDAMYVGTDATTGFDKIVTGADTVGAEQPFYQFSHVFQGLSGSVGASWAINKNWQLKANVSRGFRAPNISEISANGVHPGTNIYQIGNKDFKPEFSVQEDLDLFFDSKHVSFSIEAFNNDISNYIYNQKLLNSQGQDSVIVAGNETFKFQQSRAQLIGGELNLDIHPHPLDWLHFENSLSYVYAINRGTKDQPYTDSTRYLPDIPPLRGSTDLRADYKKRFSIFKNVYAKIGIDYFLTQNNVFSAYGTETPTVGYVLMNAGFGTAFTNKSGKIIMNLAIEANNLLNKAYQSHLSRLKYFEDYSASPNGHLGIYDMGRNISIRVDFPLDFELKKNQSKM